MLTTALIRARVVDGEVRPTFIAADKPAIRERADALVALWADAAAGSWTRGRVYAALDELCADAKDHKLVRGLAKVLEDAATFAPPPAGVDPRALRERVFRRARERGPIALEKGPFGHVVAEDVLAEVGAELGLDAAAARESLYADLPTEERLTASPIDDRDALVARYNVALVQALLLRGETLEVTLAAPEMPRLRQLFRWIKFHQLCHVATREEGGLQLTLDGPASILGASTRYGLQLARFFPALLLQERWSMKATLRWPTPGQRRTLRLDHSAGLISTRVDDGAWRSREQTWFRERFEALCSPWRVVEGDAPVDLGGRAVLVPDFRLVHEDGREALIDIVGYWRVEGLRNRLAWIARYGPPNLILAVSRKLQIGEGDVPNEVVAFKETVPAREVLAAAERVGKKP